MKKTVVMMLYLLLLVSLSGCGSVPSDEEIKAALEEGIITVEVARSKGWIDDQWMEENFEKLDANSKIYMLSPFQTTYLDGTQASSDLIEGKMCLVFINELTDGTMEKLEAFNSACKEMEETGVPILGILAGETDQNSAVKMLKDMKFPIIIRNEEMQHSLELQGFDTMLDFDVVSVFTADGGIYTAWSHNETKESLVAYAKELIKNE